MSELKVNTISNASGTNSISIGSDGSISYPNFGRKNLIINGAMQVAQRGTSFTGVTTSGYYTADRLNHTINSGTYTYEQSTDAPSGFSNSSKLTVTTPAAYNSTGVIFSNNEGQNFQHLKYGTSDALTMTVSFWVKSSVTGRYTCNLLNRTTSLSYCTNSYTVDSANTWEYKTLTFVGDTSKGITNDNSNIIDIEWWTNRNGFFATGTFTDGGTSWTGVTGDRVHSSQVSVLETSGATFQITGVQLEVGSVATPFEHRSYGEELALCQRYFHKLARDYNNGIIGSGYFYGNTTCRGFIPMPTTMRSYPSVSHVSVTDVRCGYGGGSSASSAFAGLDGATRSGVWVGYTTSSGTQGHGALLYMYPQDPEISFDAEL